MMQTVAREAALHSGVLGQDGKLDPRFHRDQVGTTISTSVGQMGNIIGTYNRLERGERIHTTEILRVLPEQSNATVAQNLKISGWGSNSQEACATGLSSVADATLLIRSGKNRVMFAGGFEDTLSDGFAREAIGLFSPLGGALSTRNETPQTAMSPYDRDRDGFVMASGGGVLVLESLESALERGATIYATVLNAEKAMDGSDNPTLLDPDRVARLLLKTLKVEGEDGFYLPDAIFTHATATRGGDAAEIDAMRKALGKYLPDIPISAIKSMHGHLLGGAGAVAAVAAVRSIHEGIIQPTINLVNRGEEFMDLNIPTQAIRTNPQIIGVNAFGFGGFDASVVIGNYR
jgi:3-oxoacyl-[acyl-carrier-protein] synthase II